MDITKQYNKIQINELASNYPKMSWLVFFDKFFGEHVRNANVHDVVITVPSYFDEVTDILETTAVHTVIDYLQLRVAAFTAPYLSKEFRKAHTNLAFESHGVHTAPDR